MVAPPRRRTAAALLAGLGHDVEDGAPRPCSTPTCSPARARCSRPTPQRCWTTGRPSSDETLGEADVEPLTWQIVQAGRAVTGAEVLRVLDRQHELARRAAAWWRGPGRAGFDILVTPTTADPGPPLGVYKHGYAPGRASAFTRVFNATGQPALSLPLGWPADGLPRGVQFVAAYGREDVLVRLGAQLERPRRGPSGGREIGR